LSRRATIRLRTEPSSGRTTRRPSIERIEDLGESILALIAFVVIGTDGITIRRECAHVVTYRAGVATVTENYASWNDALEALGRAG
jgi:hypothetical protein